MSITSDIAAIAPTTKRELAAWAELTDEQRNAARIIASTADKLTAFTWKAAIAKAAEDVKPIEPTSKRELAAWAELNDEQRDAARVIASAADKLSAAVWKSAIESAVGVIDTTEKAPSKTALAKEARAAKAAQLVANEQRFGKFTIADPQADDELFAVVLNGEHVVYTATNRRYVEVVRAALADGLAADVAAALA